MAATSTRTSSPAAGGLWRCECGYLNLDPDTCLRCDEHGRPPAADASPASAGEAPPAADRAFPARTAAPLAVGFAGLVVLANLALHAGVERWLRGHRLDVRLEAFGLIGVLFYLATWTFASMVARSARVRPAGTRPTARGVGIGFLSGAAMAVGIIVVSRASTDRPVLDPYAAVLVTDGRLFPVLTGIAILCVAAPVVEEYVFRGLLAQSLRGKGRGVAVLVSSLAFAVTHLNPQLVGYFTVMGALLCAVYLRAGLIASIVAHATVNASVVLVAVVVLGTTGTTTVHIDGLRLAAPSTWSVTSPGPPGEDLIMRRADGAAIEVLHAQSSADLDADVIAGRMTLPVSGAHDVSFDPATVRRRDLAVGHVVQIDMAGRGERGTLVVIPNGREVVILLEHAPEGSSGAASDFEHLLTDAVRE